MYKCENMAELYKIVGSEILKNGELVKPRGRETLEIINANIMLNNPRQRLVYNPERKFNLIYALVESIMLIHSQNDLKYFSKFNSNISQFSDDGKTLYGNYGLRAADNIIGVIDKLKSDKDSRQCFIPIYTKYDCQIKTKDIPCTMGIQFMIRNDKLNMHTYMRSNDIIWGTPYDIFMFTMIQEVIANTLGIDVGQYYHNATSLHVYKEYYDTLISMVKDDSEPIGFTNKCDIIDWYVVGNWYMKRIESDEPYFVSNKGSEFARLIENEISHREKRKPTSRNSDKDYWANKFTQRWYK